MKALLIKYSFLLHTTAFLLMVLASVPLYFAARSGNVPLIAALIALFVIGNLLALLAP
jgi:uncharacterized membrane protein YraQ (UPF0718 family)